MSKTDLYVGRIVRLKQDVFMKIAEQHKLGKSIEILYRRLGTSWSPAIDLLRVQPPHHRQHCGCCAGLRQCIDPSDAPQTIQMCGMLTRESIAPDSQFGSSNKKVTSTIVLNNY